MINNVTIGADIEVFLFDEETNQYKSVIGLVGGTKKKPRPVIAEGYGLQEDNVLLEFTIPVSRSKQQFLDTINRIKNELPNYVKPYSLRTIASAHFNEEELNHPKAQEFGCSEDFNAWTLEVNPRPEGSANSLRTSGLHIHIGYDNPNPVDSIALMRAMDLFLGVPSMLIDPDRERRVLYGKAGCFRAKEYGAEYRVLSGFFLSSDETLEFAYDGTMKAIEFVNQGNVINDEMRQLICQTINNNDLKAVDQVMSFYKLKSNIQCIPA